MVKDGVLSGNGRELGSYWYSTLGQDSEHVPRYKASCILSEGKCVILSSVLSKFNEPRLYFRRSHSISVRFIYILATSQRKRNFFIFVAIQCKHTTRKSVL